MKLDTLNMEVFKIKVSVYFSFCSDLFIYQKTEQFEIGLIFFYPVRNRWEKCGKPLYYLVKKIFFDTIIVHYLILKICCGTKKEGNDY